MLLAQARPRDDNHHTSTGDSDEASLCSELLLGAWARLEVGVGLQFTDLKLLVRGMQGMTERVGLNNSGLLL